MSYGCFNRDPFVEQVVVQAGWEKIQFILHSAFTRQPLMVTIPQPLTKDCQYSKSTPDTRCIGCKWKATP